MVLAYGSPRKPIQAVRWVLRVLRQIRFLPRFSGAPSLLAGIRSVALSEMRVLWGDSLGIRQGHTRAFQGDGFQVALQKMVKNLPDRI